MISFFLTHKGKDIPLLFPESYDELTDKQLTQVWNFQQREKPGDFEFILLWTRLCINPNAADTLRDHTELLTEMLDAQDPEVMLELLAFMKFMEKPLALKKSRAYRLCGLRGPKDKLQGMCFEQFGLCDTMMRLYLKSKKDKFLNLMLGALYRPFFLPWTNRFYLTDFYAWCWRFVPKYIKIRLMLNFKGVYEVFTGSYPHVYKSKTGQKASKFGYESTFINLAETKFGNYRQTLATSVRKIMIYLEEMGQQAEDMKENLEKNRKK